METRKWDICEVLTAGERTSSDRDSPSRSVTRLLDRKVLTGVTWGEGAGSTGEKRWDGFSHDCFHLMSPSVLAGVIFLEELVTVVSRKNSQVYQHLCSPTGIYWGCFYICSQNRKLSEIGTLTIIEVEQRHFFFLFLAFFLDGLWWRLRFCCLERDERKETWVGAESSRPHDLWTQGLIVLTQTHVTVQTSS